MIFIAQDVRKLTSLREGESRRRNSVRRWTGLFSFGSSVWLALSIVFGIGTADQRAAAQSTTADILRTVTDTTGAIMPGAKVTVTALATSEKREATANAAGEYGKQEVAAIHQL
jgi:hypothetical protein